MSSRTSYILFVLGVCLLLAACGPTQSQRQTTVPQVLVSLYKTQTAQKLSPEPTKTPTSTPMPPVSVVFLDGGEVLVEEWYFLYKWGESDKKPTRAFTFYEPVVRKSRELHLTVWVEGERLELVITDLELGRLIYTHKIENESLYRCESVTLETKTGESYVFGNNNISEAFLTDKPFVFGKELLLRGKVWKDGQREDFRHELDPPGSNLAAYTIAEIIFP